jgi:TatD DNase family protein
MPAQRSGWIDTHVHWDAPEFDLDRDAVLMRAFEAGVSSTINPSVTVTGIGIIQALSNQSLSRLDWPVILPAYGIHPLYVQETAKDDLATLAARVQTNRPIAIGEIGLDRFAGSPDFKLQRSWFEDQLTLAIECGLPVILHVRHAVEDVIQALKRVQGRRKTLVGGIAHAFNGSAEQADQLVRMGILLGFGGSLTYGGSTRIRRLAKDLPLDCLVLETDAPDMPPCWLRQQRNEPTALPEIAAILAEMRGIPLETLRDHVRANLVRQFPETKAWPRFGAGAHVD